MAPYLEKNNASLAYIVGDETREPLPHPWACLTEHARSNPNHPAIQSPNQTRDSTVVDEAQAEKEGIWTYAELYAKAETAAARLFHFGIRKGNTIVAFLDNRAEWALFFWVAVRLDAVLVPLNPRLINSKAEVNHALQVTKPAVLVVLHENDAEALEQVAPESVAGSVIRITGAQYTHRSPNEWKPMNSLLIPIPAFANQKDLVEHIAIEEEPMPPPSNALNQDMCVIFTSGTTSLPKASISSYQNLVASAVAVKRLQHVVPDCGLLQHIPVFHSWSICNSLAFWLSGATVVYPSGMFDPRATLTAIESAGCTHMLAVPSMIQAMVAHTSLSTTNLESLKSIDLAGTMIFPEVIEKCIDKLKAPHVAATYGTTEGSVVAAFDTHRIHYDRYSIPSIIPCGTATPGARLRVCKPESRIVLKRGEAGELHMGGLQVTRRYLDRESNNFYEEDGISWFVTGDQAKIDGGMVYILGRYKDLIIRGGENLSPATIEKCLDCIPGISESQVVGIPDEVAGEVPVAIVRKSPELDLSEFQIKQTVAQELGKVFLPQSILDLQGDLAVDDYPRTVSGKIKKRDLKATVEAFLASKNSGQLNDGSQKSTVETLIQFWAYVSGRKSEEIMPDECPDTFADSITMMQFCNLVKREMHKTISVEDLVRHVDILKQADIVDGRPMEKELSKPAESLGPPTAEDMIHVHGDECAATATRRDIEMALSPFELSWGDVEAVFPTDERTAIMTRRFHLRSSNRRHAYFFPGTSVDTLAWAIQTCLAIHPMFRSMIVHHGQDLPLYVLFRPNERWFNAAISKSYEVENAQDLSTFHLDDDDIDYAIFPGPLFKAIVVHIRNENSAGLIYIGHHSVFDALSISIWHEDLDIAIRTGRPPRGHANFKSFAEKKYFYRDSPNANAACDFHVSRLKSWTKHRSALWPPQRAPQFFRGCYSQWTHINGTLGKPQERQILESDPKGIFGINGSVHLPPLPILKSKYNVTAPIIFKAALALLNVHRTGSSQAFFGQLEAARAWPTAEGDPDPSLPNPMDIAGPTWEVVINRIHVLPSQPLLSFLYDLQLEQRKLSQFASVPFKKMEALLAATDPVENEHELYDTIYRRQCFNWLPPSRPQYTHIKEIQMISRMEVGLQWNFVHVDEANVKVNVVYDDCQMHSEEVREAVEELLEGARWIAEEAVSGDGEARLVGECPLLNKKGCEHLKGMKTGGLLTEVLQSED
ncbi:MAG: hypothetical protein Q9225_005551 [Loekoesia sp. 1 TL-2023]